MPFIPQIMLMKRLIELIFHFISGQRESILENSVLSKLSEIEKTVKQTHEDMQQFITISRSNSMADSEVQSVRSQPSSLATNDSRRLLEDHVIHQALHEPDVDQHRTDTAKGVIF